MSEIGGDPDALRAAARVVADLTGALETVAARSDTVVADVVSGWSGERSIAVRFAAQGVIGQTKVAARDAGVLSQALGRLAGALEAAQAEEDGARADVVRAEVDVPAALADPDHRARAERQAAERVRGARHDYDLAAAAFAETVAGLTAHAVRTTSAADLDALGRRRVLDGSAVTAAWAVLAGWVRPPGGPSRATIARASAGTPAQVAAWWGSLSTHARLAAVRSAPEVIGNLDGVPAWARDLANRQRLVVLRRETAIALAATTADYRNGIAHRPVLEERTRALGVLATLVAAPGRQLLTLEVRPGRRVLAAVGTGDVDRARHVAVFTPGFTSNVADSMAGYVGELDALRDVSGSVGGSTATVAWLGYDAPQYADLGAPVRSVHRPWVAAEGGVALAGFLAGVDASRRRVHLTALGHSYGSTTTGLALRRRTGTDDAVLFGSPGTGSLTGYALRVPRGRLWDVDAPGDPVGGLAWFGATPAHSTAFTHLSPDASSLGTASEGHKAYLRDGTTSQWNIASVVAGRPDLVVPRTPAHVEGPAAVG